jgi:sugar O-acyltransferase (sialic acid O-acetyltransferase NeuD family)
VKSRSGRSSRKKVVIFGMDDFARVAFTYLTQDSSYPVAGFTVHEAHMKSKSFLGLKVIPFEQAEKVYPPERCAMFVAVGFKKVNKARAAVYHLCKNKGYELITYVNSKATRFGEVAIGDNCFILENNVLQPYAKIGNNCVLWSGNHIGHDSVIGDHCFIASQAVISGNVTIGPYCFIGVNATLRDGITIAPECVIGAGALILKDTLPGQVFAADGTRPARLTSAQLRSFR